MSVASVAIKFTIIDALSRGVDAIKGRMQSLAKANGSVQQSFDRMAKSAKYSAMAGVATMEIGRNLKPAVNLAADLQAEMIGTQAELATAGKNAMQLHKELSAIKATAFDVQAVTPFDMTQIVALEKELVKAGANVSDVIGKQGAAAATAALATYEKMDPTQAGKALIGIGTPFKIAADGYMTLADNISRAASASTVGAAEIAETAKYAAGGMAGLHRTSEEMLALSAVMAQVGITGSMAGTSVKNFFNKAAGHKEFVKANGSLKNTSDIVKTLRERLSKMGDAKQSQYLKKMFGDEGMPVALALLNKDKGSYEEIVQAMKDARSLQDKLSDSLQGFTMQLTSLRGTSKSTIAELFTPALVPLTEIVKKANELTAAIGKAAMEKESLSKAVSGVSFGALGVGALATAGFGAGALYYGRKTLKGVGGFKGLVSGGAAGTAAGLAEGKVLEAATGVTPVFVTNWPANIGAGTGISAADVGAASMLGNNAKGVAVSKLSGVLTSMTKLAAVGVLAYEVTDLLVNKTGFMGWVGKKLTGGKYEGTGWMGDAVYDLMHPKKEPTGPAPRITDLGKGTKEVHVLHEVLAREGLKSDKSLEAFFSAASQHKEFTTEGKLKDTADIIRVLRYRLSRIGDEEGKQQYLYNQFGDAALPAAMALLKKGADSYAAIEKRMEKFGAGQAHVRLERLTPPADPLDKGANVRKGFDDKVVMALDRAAKSGERLSLSISRLDIKGLLDISPKFDWLPATANQAPIDASPFNPIYNLLYGGQKQQNNIVMNISIDKDERVIAKTSDMNTKASINLKRGHLGPVR